MQLRQLEYFYKASQCGSLSAAARDLHVSEQSLSKAVTSFERELGVNLFIRTTRGLELTETGVVVLEKTSAILSAVKELRREATRAYGEETTISICFYEGFLGEESDPLPVEMLVNYQRSHPELYLNISECSNEQVGHRVSKSVTDLGVFIGEIPAQCSSVELTKIQLYAVVSKNNPLSKKKSLGWSDLDGKRMVHLRAKYSMQDDIVSICERYGVRFLDTRVVAGVESSLHFVYCDEGIMLLDRRFSRIIDHKRAKMVPLSIDAGALHPKVSVIWHDSLELTRSHKQLIDFIRKRIAEKKEQVKGDFPDASPRD